MKIKICGLTSPKEASYVNACHADFAGMVLFFPKSKRNISISTAQSIIKELDPAIFSVAVVVSPTARQIAEITNAGFDYIQIHGNLDRELLSTISLPVLKAFNVSDIAQYDSYHACPQIAGYVFDAQEPGSGKTFDWNQLQKLPRDEKLFLLAGGLTAQNVQDAIRLVHPDGVDVSSGVEYTDRPGKDPKRITAFVNQVRLA